MRRFRISSILISLFLLSGCSEEEAAITSADMKSGEDLYAYYCMACHEKRGPGAYMEKLADKPPTPAHKIILMIKYGSDQQHNMPVFQEFEDDQASLIAQYIVDLQFSNNQSVKPTQ